jgi:outer membrane lipoprotein-sorting protein
MFVGLTLAIAFQVTAPPTAAQVVQRVQAHYRNVAQVRVAFAQTVTNATFGTASKSRGMLYVKRPSKMRWDYASSRRANQVSKSFLSDGRTLWMVDHQGLQYYQQPVKGSVLPVAITFLAGRGNLLASFRAAIVTGSKRDAPGDVVVSLTPRRANASYVRLLLVVESGSWRVKSSIVLNANGDTNAFRFGEPKAGKPLANRMFVFNPRANPTYRKARPAAPKP